jgi:hypothetical protein
MTYSQEWKQKKKKWIEKHKDYNGKVYWSIHYISDTKEYSSGEYSTEELAEKNLKKYNV